MSKKRIISTAGSCDVQGKAYGAKFSRQNFKVVRLLSSLCFLGVIHPWPFRQAKPSLLGVILSLKIKYMQSIEPLRKNKTEK